MASMSPEAFLEVLKKSKLLSADELTQAQDTVLLTSNAVEFSNILIEQGLLTEWQASELMAGKTGFHIGNYVLLDLLGQGGMGIVYRARHTTMKREVALKLVKRKARKDPASLERFLAEARAAASLDHPNIVRAYDVDKEKDRFFIVMEYVNGRDLQEYVDSEGPLDFEFLVDCVRQTAAGLAHAHRRNMVHCDIKPSNLLVNQAGAVKILDMGMARLLNESDEDSSVIRDERMLGTVDYMAPEQAMDGPGFDHRADVYSLGCTMYFLMTGHPPFDEGTLSQRIVRHQTQAPPDILAEHPDAPPDLIQICLKMMAKDPADRYQSADEIVKILEAWRPPELIPTKTEGEPVRKSTGVAIDEDDFKTEEPDLPASQPKSVWEDERRLIFWIATVAIALACLLLVVVLLFRGGNSGTDDTAGAGDRENRQQQDRMPSDSAKDSPTESRGSAASPKGTASKGAQRKSAKTERKKADRGGKKKSPRTHHAKKRRRVLPKREQTALGPTGKQGRRNRAGSKLFPPKFEKPTTKQSPKEATKEPVDPLRSVENAVRLSSVSSQESPLTLGRIDSRARKALDVQLLGGDQAIRDGGRFVMQAQPGGRKWLIRQVGVGSGSVDVAQLAIEKDELRLAWLPGAGRAAAQHLRNCILKITSGKHRRLVRLARPEATRPLSLPLKNGDAQVRIPLEAPAKAEAMRVMVTGVDGMANKLKVRLKEKKTENIAVFKRNGCKIELRARYSVRGQSAVLDVTAYAVLASRDKPMRFSVQNIRALGFRREFVAGQVNRMSQALKAGNSSVDRKELRQLEKELDWLTRLAKWFQDSDGVMKIQFQQYVDVGGQRVVLLDTRCCPNAGKKGTFSGAH